MEKVQRLVASLDAKQSVFLFMEDADKAGGYLGYSLQLATEPIRVSPWVRDPRAYFMFKLVTTVNSFVISQYNLWDDAIFFAGCLLLQCVAALKVEPKASLPLDKLRDRIEGLIGGGLATDAALRVISNAYFEGRNVLLKDAAEVMEDYRKRCLLLAELYNEIAKAVSLEGFSQEHLTPTQALIEHVAQSLTGVANLEIMAESGSPQTTTAAVELMLARPNQ